MDDQRVIGPLCSALAKADTPTQKQALRCLTHLLLHEQALKQLEEAASRNRFLSVLISLLRREASDSQALQVVLNALAALGTDCCIATQLIDFAQLWPDASEPAEND